jgi:quinol monooxygenase YgiN
VPGIRQFEVGIREAGREANADVVLVSTFDDAAALDAYQNHPVHKAVSAQLGPLRESRSVLDHEIGTP